MTRSLVIFAILLLLSCNSKTKTADSSDKKDSSSLVAGANWSKEDENEFLSDCVENAKQRFSEDSAFIHCKCVLQQLKQKFPTMDSAANYVMDTANAAEIAKLCE